MQDMQTLFTRDDQAYIILPYLNVGGHNEHKYGRHDAVEGGRRRCQSTGFADWCCVSATAKIFLRASEY